MLYRPEAFEPLVDAPWSELRARSAIRTSSRTRTPPFVGRASSGERMSGRWHSTSPMKNLYVGTPSAVGARPLQRRGFTETGSTSATSRAATSSCSVNDRTT